MEQTLYDEFNSIESRHWWFLARQRIFITLIESFFHHPKDSKILDIGCGTGMNMKNLAKFGSVIGMDLSMDAIRYCQQIGNPLCQGDMSNLPFQSNSFDIITILDVVEHLEDDLGALKEVYRICNNKGILLVAVPAFQFLWGEHDELAHHIRRYTLGELRKLVEESGFEILKISYNNFFFFPIGLVFRYLKRFFRRLNNKRELTSDFANTAPPILNEILREIYAFEGKLLKHFNLPLGLSILCICRKSI